MKRLSYHGTPHMEEGGIVTPTYSDYPVRKIMNKLAEYEDAEEQGLLLMLPCPIGSTIYSLEQWDDESEYKLYEYIFDGITGNGLRLLLPDDNDCSCSFEIDAFGKTLFLNKSVAIAALQELKEGEC